MAASELALAVCPVLPPVLPEFSFTVAVPERQATPAPLPALLPVPVPSAQQQEAPYAYRRERFRDKRLAVCEGRVAKHAALPVRAGVLPDHNGLVELTPDNRLVLQLFDADHDRGMCAEDVGAFWVTWLRSVSPDAWRADAIACAGAALLALDNRAVRLTDDFAAARELRAERPPKDAVLPSLDEWVAVWYRLREGT